MKNTEENCEMIWKIRKKIVKYFENMEERYVEK